MTDNRKGKSSLKFCEKDYDVGYGKPPVNGRFKKGKSGNPKGRPKGTKNAEPAWNEERLKDIILQEAYRTITVKDGNRNVTVPMAQAVVRALAVNAARGQHRAQRLFAEILSATERQNKARSDEWMEEAISYKVEWDSELERREKLGITGPEPIPHPDQIKVDLRRNKVWIVGPTSKEEKEALEMFILRKHELEDELTMLTDELKNSDSVGIKEIIQSDIDHTNKVLGILGNGIRLLS